MKQDIIKDIPADKIEYVISQYVHKKRDRDILRLKWLDELTFHEIAIKVDMSDRGVQYVVDRNLTRLLKYIL